jgi:hypothetical protein
MASSQELEWFDKYAYFCCWEAKEDEKDRQFAHGQPLYR